MDERRRIEEMEKQMQLEKQITNEAKMSEVEYLKQLKENDYQAYLNHKKGLNNHIFKENKEFVKSLVDKDEKEICEWKNREALKKNLVKEELSQQIVQKQRMSEMARKSKLEEVN